MNRSTLLYGHFHFQFKRFSFITFLQLFLDKNLIFKGTIRSCNCRVNLGLHCFYMSLFMGLEDIIGVNKHDLFCLILKSDPVNTHTVDQGLCWPAFVISAQKYNLENRQLNPFCIKCSWPYSKKESSISTFIWGVKFPYCFNCH